MLYIFLPWKIDNREGCFDKFAYGMCLSGRHYVIVGCLVLLVCYVLLLLRGFDIAASAREPVGRLVAATEQVRVGNLDAIDVRDDVSLFEPRVRRRARPRASPASRAGTR